MMTIEQRWRWAGYSWRRLLQHSTVPAPSAATVPALIHVFNDIPAPSPVWWEWCGWDNPYELRRNGLWHQLAPVGSAGVAPLTVPVGLLLLLWCRRLQPAPGPNQPSVVPVPPATKVVPVRAPPPTVTLPPRHQLCEKKWSAPRCQIWCHAVKTAPEWIWICDSWWWQGECNLPSLGCKTAKVVFACSTLWKSDTSAANPVTEWVLLFRGFASLNLSGTRWLQSNCKLWTWQSRPAAEETFSLCSEANFSAKIKFSSELRKGWIFATASPARVFLQSWEMFLHMTMSSLVAQLLLIFLFLCFIHSLYIFQSR